MQGEDGIPIRSDLEGVDARPPVPAIRFAVKAATDATIFDELHRFFGAGDYDGVQPWYEARALGISKIRRTREKRGVAVSDLLLAIEYAKTTSQVVKHSWDLYKLIDPARRWKRGEDQVDKSQDLEAAIADAIAIEGSKTDSVWLDRLIRAAGPARVDIYEEWAAWNLHP